LSLEAWLPAMRVSSFAVAVALGVDIDTTV
jgi:hypothetical protein